MQFGFVKTATATPQIRVADCDYNCGQIAAAVRQADAQGVELLVLPELCITGYTCGDLFYQQPLLRGAKDALQTLLRQTADTKTVCVVGLPLQHDGGLYNCAAVIQGGRVLGVVPKTHLPNYSEFYEQRHFSPAPAGLSEITLGEEAVPFGTTLLFQSEEQPDFCFAVEICEDLWVPAPPSVRHAQAGALLIANLSASNETIGKPQYRRELVTGQSARLLCGYLYADAGDGESTTDMVFSGHSLIAENGRLLAQTVPFENALCVTEIDVQMLARERMRLNTYTAGGCSEYKTVLFSSPAVSELVLTRPISAYPFVPADDRLRQQRCDMILTMQAAGLRKRLAHTRCRQAVLGVSGGLDSSLALIVCVKAMDQLGRDRKDILAVTMPCFGTTSRTRGNAQRLCEALGVSFRQVDITASVKQHFADIGQDPDVLDVTYENAQARERTQVLMDLANQTGGMVIGTGDLSELALGWATYNGDHMSMYGVNTSVPKTLVRYLVKFYADSSSDARLRQTLLDILDTPVSPELLPADGEDIAQKTEDLVGPYKLHDFFLYYVLRFGFSPKKIYVLAKQAFLGSFDDATILKWLGIFFKRFFAQQFKRSCMPDGPKIGSVCLSPRSDFRMPSDASVALWLKELDTLLDKA